MKFGTKAETLERLSGALKSAKVLPLYWCTVKDCKKDGFSVARRVIGAFAPSTPLIVRSSARNEDRLDGSQAGCYRTVRNVIGEDALRDAIEAVMASYGRVDPEDQVLVQPMLADVAVAGVAFSREPATGSPYIVVNYDDTSGDASSVTGGRSGDLMTFVHAKCAPHLPASWLGEVIAMVRELEELFGFDSLDVEFARDRRGQLYLFQVRPLPVGSPVRIDEAEHRALLLAIARKVESGVRPHPFLHGARTVYGVMPDWNPAEIIGVRPKPLALSLYRELVTDGTWAYQRNNYGYKNLRSFPLVVHFQGLPYVDVRVSFNSFVPQELDAGLAERLVNYYIERLLAAPALHDKVEFEIVFSCYTLDLPTRLEALAKHGFTQADRAQLAASLRRLTNRIIHRDTGLWRADRDRLAVLEERHRRIMGADMDDVSRIYWLLEDCKRYGTLPFAGLARAGFIAVQMLRSLVSVGVLNENEYDAFMTSLNTVGSQMTRDLTQLDRTTFLAKYGHLRPGTYDILSPRYDEAPDLYFDWSSRPAGKMPRADRFSLSLAQMREIGRLLEEHGLEHDVVGLFDFLQAGIELREHAKFVFTRNLSDALALLVRLGERYAFSREEIAYAEIRCIAELYASSMDAKELFTRSIEEGKERYERTARIVLPPLITSLEDVWAFHLPQTEPNFITQKVVTAHVCSHTDKKALRGAIVAIQNADPGYDWLFSHPIAGFITSYGGVNSHMAIRANELGLPAVIGAGEALYQQWANAKTLRIDCANRRVEVLR